MTKAPIKSAAGTRPTNIKIPHTLTVTSCDKNLCGQRLLAA
jgi:hypothetical protein